MHGEAIELEYRDAALGDTRRSRRLERIGATLARDPKLSFPEAMGNEGQLEALYRFLNNDDIAFDAVHAPHADRTKGRCDLHDRVLVLHDTTALEFEGEREGIGRLTGAKHGFFMHTSLAVTVDRFPLGVIHAEPWSRTGARRGNRERNKRYLRKDPTRESLRWWRGVEASEDRLGATGRAIHVMDREGDNFDLYAQLIDAGHRFVIRVAHNRNVVGAEAKLKELASASPSVLRRTVRLAPRSKRIPRDVKIHGSRGEREAKLRVSAIRVTLQRPTNFSKDSPPQLDVNVVAVTEVDCPAGETPVAWYLVTSESIRCRKAVADIVDIYRARWVIEEFFKALKTGCQFEKRQLESYASLRLALAIFIPIAVGLLALRAAARTDPNGRCAALSPTHLELLRRCTNMPLNAAPTNEEAYMALAAFGGHLRSNGDPGWLLLGRAYERLLLLEQGWNARGSSREM